MSGDLSLEDALALLGTKTPQGTDELKVHTRTKHIRTTIQYPARNTKHVTWHDTFTPNKSLRCSSRGCSAPTPYKMDGVPYCSIHLIFGLSVRVDQLESEVNFLKKGYGNL